MSEFPIKGIHHVEFNVADAWAITNQFRKRFGFQLIAQSIGEENSFVLRQGGITYVVKDSRKANSQIRRFVELHGDGVKDIAFSVEDAPAAFREALERGAQQSPSGIFAIKTYGSVRHSFVDEKVVRPWEKYERVRCNTRPVGLFAIDHFVGNVPKGHMNPSIDLYRRLGFNEIDHFAENINVGKSAFMSKVSQNGRVISNVNEPDGDQPTHIDDFLAPRNNNGPGVQHKALATRDIVSTVRKMRSRGQKFLPIPDEYYEMLPERFPKIAREEIVELQELGILLDVDKKGKKLKQIFTEHLFVLDSLFDEVIEREDWGLPSEAEGFGRANVAALFAAKERASKRLQVHS